MFAKHLEQEIAAGSNPETSASFISGKCYGSTNDSKPFGGGSTPSPEAILSGVS